MTRSHGARGHPRWLTATALGIEFQVISAIWIRDLVGLLDCDDGRMLLFNLQSLQPGSQSLFKVGTRVDFLEEADALAPRAVRLVVHGHGSQET